QPWQVPPRLLNTNELSSLLERSYPPKLRMNSITGLTTARVFVSKDGSVDSTYLTTTTGSSRLDAAASNVVRGMKFSAATMNGEPVGVWLEVPIGFVPENERHDSGGLPRLLHRKDLQRK